MYFGNNQHVDEINFFDSEKFVSFPTLVDDKTPGVVDGILPAGSIVPANDATATAVTINDVDVSHGPEMVGGIVDGFLNAARLPVQPSAEAVTALNRITFSNLKEEA